MTQEQQRPFTILVPLDSSERAASALPVAVDICQRLDGELALIQVLPVIVAPFEAPTGFAAGYIPPETNQRMHDDQERAARVYLEQVAAPLRAGGLPVRAYIQHGDPASSLIDTIADRAVGLVVMTSHGRTGLARFALGSVADRIVRSGVAPVLLLRSFGTSNTSMMALRHAVVPLNGTLLSEAVIDVIGLRLAGAVIAEFTLLRVVDKHDGSEAERVAQDYLEDMRSRFLQRLNGRKATIKTMTLVGSPSGRILEAARTESADLILMATRGESGIGRLAFGSTADHILQGSELPALFIRPQKG
jgi:nucleotide-binding universal stress UspA family protein